MRLDSYGLAELLPHRPPILLVDSIEIDVEARTALGTKAITLSEPCFWQCDTDAGMRYPYGLLMESLGQTCAALWLAVRRAAGDANAGTLYFAKAEGVELLGAAEPGDVLTHTVSLQKIIADTAFMSGRSATSSGDVLVAESLVAASR